MPGKITFHFDDGHASHYTQAFPVFKAAGVPGCLALPVSPAGMTFDEAREMQDAGWEILSHSLTHCRLRGDASPETARREIADSLRCLTAEGLRVRQFVTPYSLCDPAWRPLLAESYDAAFTVYTNSAKLPVGSLAIARPVNRYALHRACLAGRTPEELRRYIDYVADEDAWLVFYDHDIGAGVNITAEGLAGLLAYCAVRGVRVLTSSEALDGEPCLTRVLREGFDGRECLVHARVASDGQNVLLTSQLLDVSGCDAFGTLQVCRSADGGRSWSGFSPDPAFGAVFHDGLRTIPSDMTPLYHKKTGRFLVTGHTVDYPAGENRPVDVVRRTRAVTYAVFDPEAGRFSPVRRVEMPDPEKYCDCGSGCSQCLETEDGGLLIPVAFRELRNGRKTKGAVAVMRCSFDGETVAVLAIGSELRREDEERGITEASVARQDGRYFLTIRGNAHGYLSVSDDGLRFSPPEPWRWEDGEPVPTYNTQSHWLHAGGRLFLVYTRKNGENDHVFRHRAPLYAAEVDTGRLVLRRDTEFVVVPERGARLGNFGVCDLPAGEGLSAGALVVASEWMQPAGCETRGSDNAVWYTEVFPPVRA